jgi:uncharacterized damage-inducible protein DinB
MYKSISLLLLCAAAWGQSNPQVASSKLLYEQGKNYILRSVDKMPDAKWDFKPAPEVRTYGQILAHIADGQYEFCGVVREGKAVDKGVEKSAKTKVQVQAALKEAFAYCDQAFSGLTDAASAAMVNFGGQERTKLSMLNFNTVHNSEHYGNIVTYLRINGIVPPSSERQR